MPWLSIIMALVTFFLSGGTKKETRGRAALAALAVGAGTYAVTHHTDWGSENLGWLDGVEVDVDSAGTVTTTTGPDDPVQIVKPSTGSGGQTGTSGFWGAVGGWLTSPVGQVTTGAAAGSAAGIPTWALLAGGVLLFMAMK